MEGSTSSQPGPLLDHIVILVPHKVLVDLPSWLASEFTILTGGKHAGGVTENKLIVFEDGVYIELIAFADGTDPERRHEHWWGRKTEGTIVDWAYTLAEESDFGAIQRRVLQSGSGIRYADPVPGGRIRPDGTELKWAVAFPGADEDASAPTPVDRGELPFWCFDRTPRRLRVPRDPDSNVSHPCGAIGVAQLTVTLSDKGRFAAVREAYRSVHEAAADDNEPGHAEAAETCESWEVGSPVAVHAEKRPRVCLRIINDAVDAGSVGQDEAIRLALFVRGRQSTTLSGKLGGRLLEIELKSGH